MYRREKINSVTRKADARWCEKQKEKICCRSSAYKIGRAYEKRNEDEGDYAKPSFSEGELTPFPSKEDLISPLIPPTLSRIKIRKCAFATLIGNKTREWKS